MALARFDWSTRLKAAAERLFRFGGVAFAVDMDCGWSMSEILELLHDNLIETFAEVSIPEDDIHMFCTPREDANEAVQILDRHGIIFIVGIYNV